MSGWDWWDAWRSGDPDESQRALDEETDRSLDKDPGRWSSRSSVDADQDDRRGGRGGHVADRRHQTGKGHVAPGESGERSSWKDSEWRKAREDYERQNPHADDRDEDRGIFWFAAVRWLRSRSSVGVDPVMVALLAFFCTMLVRATLTGAP